MPMQRSAMNAVRLLLFGVYLLLAQGMAQAQVTTLKEGSAIFTVADKTIAADRLSLPFSWDKMHGATNGFAIVKLRFSATPNGKDLGMYVPRLGNAFVIRLNSHEIKRFGTLPPNLYDDSTRDPLYFVLPEHLIQADNLLEISIGAIGGRLGGLSRIMIGPPDEVYPQFRRVYFWQVNASQLVVIISAILGMLSMLLWVKQRDVIFLYYGLGELFWSLQTMRSLLDHPPLPWPWWGLLPLIAFNLACPLLIKFAMAVMGHRKGWVNGLADAALVLAVPAAALAMLAGMLWVIPIYHGLIILMCIGMFIRGIPLAIGAKLSEKRVMGFAIAVIVTSAVRDFLMMRFAEDSYALLPWTRFAWVAFGVSMAWIIAERMRRAEFAVSKNNETLEARLAERDHELSAAFERDKATAKEIGVIQERARLMRDLHDGLGSHLVGALRIAQKTEVSKEELTSQLREAIDQLKITVDASQETDGDIPAILGAVRYRLSSRLEAAGIALKWDVARLSQFEGWGVRQAYHLQMFLYEAFTNLIVHSEATRASLVTQRVKTSPGEEYLHIELSDNGKGFDVDQAQKTPGKGLSNMAMRAKELGGRSNFSSRFGNTRITLILPLQK
jgi:signal transduction histidine kinase